MKDSPVGIQVIDDAFGKCEKIIDFLEETGFQKSRVMGERGEELSEHRTSSTVYIPFLSFRNPPEIEEMNRAVYKAMDEYAVDWDFTFYTVEQSSAQKYEPGQEYHTHMDFGPGYPRILSAVAYLNNVEEGGETYFPTFDYHVAPKPGRIAVFPSNFIYRHAALPPARGVKYAVAFWAQ